MNDDLFHVILLLWFFAFAFPGPFISGLVVQRRYQHLLAAACERESMKAFLIHSCFSVLTGLGMIYLGINK